MPTTISYTISAEAGPVAPAPEAPTAYDATQYARQLLDLLPRGRLWNQQDSKLRGLMLAIGEELARVDARGLDLIDESDPRTADETIEQWEEMLSLPDERVTVIPATLAERRIAITQKYTERGGQSVQFFVDLALACGYTLQPVGFLAAPVISSVDVLVGGGSLAAGARHYRVTALNDEGETTASTSVDVTVALNDRARVNWTQVVGATGYRVFGSSAGAELLIAEVGDVATYTDDGSITPAGPLPGANTAATEPITRYVGRMCRVGIARCGDRLYGAAFAYAMRLNVMPPSGTVLPVADFERVIEHLTHSHIVVIFDYL